MPAFKTYASDAIHDAMMLAQTKAINSFSFKDCLNYMNYVWRDVYQRLNRVDPGYYTRTVELKKERTTIPPWVMNTVKVFAAQNPGDLIVDIYKQSGNSDRAATKTYSISGYSLLCPDAVRRRMWCTYVAQPPILFFTKNNRDPRIIENQVPEWSNIYGMWEVDKVLDKLYLRYRKPGVTPDIDITGVINIKGDEWEITYLHCDYPYVFVSFKHKISSEHQSFIFRDIDNANVRVSEYNPFAYTGRNSDVEFYKCWWNDSTGLGVVVKDYHDGQFKEMGFTPDTELDYPLPEMYHLFVAKLAKKFALGNESELMLVENELTEAQLAFDEYLNRDESSFARIDLLNTGLPQDWL